MGRRAAGKEHGDERKWKRQNNEIRAFYNEEMKNDKIMKNKRELLLINYK